MVDRKMLSLDNLPDDVLCTVFSLCDEVSLQRLCQVCRRFSAIVSRDCFWISKSKHCLATNQVSENMKKRSCYLMSAKDKCRVAQNWKQKKYTKMWLLTHNTKYMPWLKINAKHLWISVGNDILGYSHRPSGQINPGPLRVLNGFKEDVCHFTVNDKLVVSGGSEGFVTTWSQTKAKQQLRFKAHSSSIHGLDMLDNIIISGSRDKTVKIWTASNKRLQEKQRINFNDRIWSVSVNPLGNEFVCGSAGCSEHPLMLYSMTTCQRISCLGDHYKHGAGVLDCLYENCHNLLTCGYDTYIRLWDSRSCSNSAIKWENPFDMTVCCLASDQNMTFISGSAGNGLVWLWDKRSTRPVQMYYVGLNSPVYSVAFDPCHLYVALDTSLCLLNFT